MAGPVVLSDVLLAITPCRGGPWYYGVSQSGNWALVPGAVDLSGAKYTVSSKGTDRQGATIYQWRCGPCRRYTKTGWFYLGHADAPHHPSCITDREKEAKRPAGQRSIFPLHFHQWAYTQVLEYGSGTEEEWSALVELVGTFRPTGQAWHGEEFTQFRQHVQKLRRERPAEWRGAMEECARRMQLVIAMNDATNARRSLEQPEQARAAPLVVAQPVPEVVVDAAVAEPIGQVAPVAAQVSGDPPAAVDAAEAIVNAVEPADIPVPAVPVQDAARLDEIAAEIVELEQQLDAQEVRDQRERDRLQKAVATTGQLYLRHKRLYDEAVRAEENAIAGQQAIRSASQLKIKKLNDERDVLNGVMPAVPPVAAAVPPRAGLRSLRKRKIGHFGSEAGEQSSSPSPQEAVIVVPEEEPAAKVSRRGSASGSAGAVAAGDAPMESSVEIVDAPTMHGASGVDHESSDRAASELESVTIEIPEVVAHESGEGSGVRGVDAARPPLQVVPVVAAVADTPPESPSSKSGDIEDVGSPAVSHEAGSGAAASPVSVRESGDEGSLSGSSDATLVVSVGGVESPMSVVTSDAPKEDAREDSDENAGDYSGVMNEMTPPAPASDPSPSEETSDVGTLEAIDAIAAVAFGMELSPGDV